MQSTRLKKKKKEKINSSLHVSVPWVVKLKSDGFSLPLGSLMLGSRSSSKNECAQASKGVRRAVGVYSSRREHRAMASGGVRGRNTWIDVKIGHPHLHEVYNCVVFATVQSEIFLGCHLHHCTALWILDKDNIFREGQKTIAARVTACSCAKQPHQGAKESRGSPAAAWWCCSSSCAWDRWGDTSETECPFMVSHLF